MKICICDDNMSIHNEIKSLLSSLKKDDTFIISDFFSGRELIQSCKNGKLYDIVFLDIEMNDINGIETAEKIRELSPKSIIIFVSGYTDYIFEAFRIEALHFIVKPIKEKEFYEVFDRAVKKHLIQNSTIILKWQSERHVIPVDEISFVEGYRRHLTVHTAAKTFEAVGKLSEMYQTLRPHGFVRIHQGFTVNMNFIKNFGASEVELTDGTKVPMSVRRRMDALKAYDDFIRSRKW